MIDFLRSLTRSAEEKRRERLNAYVDGALSERERRRFEQELAGDPRLQAELKEIQAVRAALRRLPRVRPPRNFTLDPAAYSVPRPYRAAQWYPVLRTATAFAAVAFAFLLALSLFLTPDGAQAPLVGVSSTESSREMAVEAEFAAPEEAIEEEAVAEGDFAESAAESAEQTAPMEMEAAGEAAAEEAAAVTDEAAAGAAAPAPEATQPAREEALVAPESEGAVDVAAEDALESPAYPAPPPQLAAPIEYPEPPTPTAEEISVQPAPTIAPESPAETAEASATQESEPAPLPILLLAQIATGVVFAGLLVALLVVRRRL
jgi:hypothetical protein